MNDIALLKLDSESQAHMLGFMPINSDFVNNNWVGDELQMVGYGVTSTGGEDSSIKRTADMYIDEVCTKRW